MEEVLGCSFPSILDCLSKDISDLTRQHTQWIVVSFWSKHRIAVLQFNIQIFSQTFQPHKWSFLETGLTNL